MPGGMNIYGFTYGDALNAGRETVVGFDNDGYLRVMDASGAVEWKSSERFGGGASYLEFPREAAASISGEQLTERIYLDPRLYVTDIDNDGKTEVIVINNEELSGRRLTGLRVFKNGHIECYSGNELGLVPQWKTQSVTGYISDLAIADVDNDGEDELVFSVAAKTAPILGRERSYIVAQEITQQPKQKE
jgi:hypothetical protein